MMRQAGIGDVDAFIAYQKGMEAFKEAHSIENPLKHLPVANQWFDRTLELVPDNVDALFLRTDMYGHILFNHATATGDFTPATLTEARDEIRTSLGQAMRAAPERGHARHSRGRAAHLR